MQGVWELYMGIG